MKKRKFLYAIHGYRWAPESFQASKKLAGRPPMNIPLTLEERQEVGKLILTQGFDAAVGYVKHVERTRDRQRKSVITYGFHTLEDAGQFVYCPQLYFRSDATLNERLYMFKKIRSVLNETQGRVVVSTQCELDGEYHPINVQENTVTADFSRPLRIPMGSKIFRDGLESPYRPWSKAPKKARPHKHRKTTPTR